MPLKIVIIEDQVNIRKDLRKILAKNTSLNVVAETGTVREALILLPAIQPDLVLLDILLTDGSGFDILSSLIPLPFKVIFLTAYEEYAIKAIKYGALDYLLKPVDATEMETAIDRMLYSEKPDAAQLIVAARHFYGRDPSPRIALHANSFWQVVSIDDIVYAEGSQGTIFHLQDNQKITTRKSLQEYEELLPRGRFIRIHQSYLIHHRYVNRYHKAGFIVLVNGIELPVSARRKEFVEAFLSNQ